MLDDVTEWLHRIVKACGAAYDWLTELGVDAWGAGYGWIVSTGAARWAAWLAGGALALGIWQEVRAWRSRPRVIFTARRLGRRPGLDEQGNVLAIYGIGELTNVGDAPATSLTVVVKDALQIMEDGYLIPKTMHPFQSVRFLFDPAEAPAPWLHVCWFTPSHKVSFIAWVPINDFSSDGIPNPLSDVILKQQDERRKLSRQPWRRFKAKRGPVGPDGVDFVKIRGRRRGASKKVDAAFGMDSEP